MANVFTPHSRHLVPNFRRFLDTVALGELHSVSTIVPDAVRIDLRSRIAEWNSQRTVGLAGDIVSAALVSSDTDMPAIGEAATFIIAHPDMSSPSLMSTARKILTPVEPMRKENTLLPRLTILLENNSRRATYRQIRTLKNTIARFGNNPILFTELARLYLILGNKERASRNIAIALSLAPYNRYVLRSAARLYAHCDDAERAFDLLHKNPRSSHDPWLASAELAMAGLIRKSRMVLKRAAHISTSEQLSPLSLTEVRAGVGSVELLNGNRRRSKRLFQASLQHPNDNSLAQVEWGLSLDPLLEVNLSSYDVSCNYEALALEAFNQRQWESVLQHCESWLMDTPFASRPVLMASHVASVVLDDFASAQSFCQAGLLASSDNPRLVNDYAYALALDDKPEEALKVLDEVPLSSVGEVRERVCLTATRGLAYFRSGRIAEGREMYTAAMADAKTVKDLTFRQIAVLSYVREELLATKSSRPCL